MEQLAAQLNLTPEQQQCMTSNRLTLVKLDDLQQLMKANSDFAEREKHFVVAGNYMGGIVPIGAELDVQKGAEIMRKFMTGDLPAATAEQAASIQFVKNYLESQRS